MNIQYVYMHIYIYCLYYKSATYLGKVYNYVYYIEEVQFIDVKVFKVLTDLCLFILFYRQVCSGCQVIVSNKVSTLCVQCCYIVWTVLVHSPLTVTNGIH